MSEQILIAITTHRVIYKLPYLHIIFMNLISIIVIDLVEQLACETNFIVHFGSDLFFRHVYAHLNIKVRFMCV